MKISREDMEKIRSAIDMADQAAQGDSNDEEIAALNDLVDTLLDVIGIYRDQDDEIVDAYAECHGRTPDSLRPLIAMLREAGVRVEMIRDE